MPATQNISWLVRCDIRSELLKAEEAAERAAAPESIVTDTAYSRPGGVAEVVVTDHRIGDYFSAIEVMPTGDEHEFKIVFNPAPNVDRYWKDLMVQILRVVRKSANDVSVRRE